MSIAVGGFDMEHALAEFKHRDIEGATSKVIHRDLLVFLLVQTIRQRGGSRFVDDAQHFETRDAARILCGLALRIIEIGRGRYDCLGDFLAQPRLGIRFELAQNHGRDFRRAEALWLALHFHFDGCVTISGSDYLIGDAFNFFLHFVELSPHEPLN